jgi:two-component system, cell cycle response regulator
VRNQVVVNAGKARTAPAPEGRQGPALARADVANAASAVEQPLNPGVDLSEALRLLNLAGISPPQPDADVAASVVVGTATVMGSAAAKSACDLAYLQQVIDGLCALSARDGLTGIANRRMFNDALEREIHRSERTGEAFGLLLIDIDHFKKINDQHGHLAGDVVLKAVASTIAGSFRNIDTVARYGGEEFAVILPNASESFLSVAAERARAVVASTPVEAKPGLSINVTVSIGSACSRGHAVQSAEALIDVADQNLYQAKRLGRNRVQASAGQHAAVTPMERAQLLSLFDSSADSAADSAAGAQNKTPDQTS